MRRVRTEIPLWAVAISLWVGGLLACTIIYYAIWLALGGSFEPDSRMTRQYQSYGDHVLACIKAGGTSARCQEESLP